MCTVFMLSKFTVGDGLANLQLQRNGKMHSYLLTHSLTFFPVLVEKVDSHRSPFRATFVSLCSSLTFLPITPFTFRRWCNVPRRCKGSAAQCRSVQCREGVALLKTVNGSYSNKKIQRKTPTRTVSSEFVNNICW